MKKLLLVLGVLVGSLGIYGLADAAQTVIGTTVLKSGQSLNVTCSGTKLSTTRVSAKTITDNCWGTATTSAAPPNTTSAAPSKTTGGNCTDPVYSTSDAEGTYNADPNDGEYWWVNNDAWSGSHGPQAMNVCSQSSWDAVSNQPNVGGQVETYPDTEYDVGGRTSPSTEPISGFSTISSTFSEEFPTTGDSFDAAYDLWTNNYTNETMIWNQWGGTQDYWGECAEPGPDQNDCVGPGGANSDSIAVTLDGVAFHVLDNGGEIIFFRDSQVSSGSVDILAAFQWEVSEGLAKSTDVPTQLEYGVEISATSGTETFPMTGLTFNVS